MLKRRILLLLLAILFCGCAKNFDAKPQNNDKFNGHHKKILPLPKDEKVFILS